MRRCCESYEKRGSSEIPPTNEILLSMARSLNLLVKLKVKEVQGDRNNTEMILLLHSLGCRPVEIAEALGKTSNDVNPVISRARKQDGKRKKPARKKLSRMDGRQKENLDRDQQILDRLAKIEHKVDSIEQTNAFALRAEADKHFAEVKKIFGRSHRRAQIYLAADGARSVQEIAKYLHIQRQNVGPDLRRLGEEGLLKLVDFRVIETYGRRSHLTEHCASRLSSAKNSPSQRNGLKQSPGKKAGRRKRRR